MYNIETISYIIWEMVKDDQFISFGELFYNVYKIHVQKSTIAQAGMYGAG